MAGNMAMSIDIRVQRVLLDRITLSNTLIEMYNNNKSEAEIKDYYKYSNNLYKHHAFGALFYMSSYKSLYEIIWGNKIPTKTAMKTAIEMIFSLEAGL